MRKAFALLTAASVAACSEALNPAATGSGDGVPAADASSIGSDSEGSSTGTDSQGSSNGAQGPVGDGGRPANAGDAANSSMSEAGRASDAAHRSLGDAAPSGDGGDAATPGTPGGPEGGMGSDAASLDSGLAGPDSAVAPLIFMDFNPSDFNGTKSTDGVWQIAGPWVGTGSNYLNPANAQLLSTYGGSPGGYLSLTVVSTNNAFSGSCGGGASASNPCQGSEIQTNGTTAIAGSAYNGSNLHYGYYEVRVKVTSVPGVVVSFFWKEVNYGNGEIDYEWLTNESWATNPSENGIVHLTVQGGPSQPQNLSFNPTGDFHRYGFLWTPNEVEYVVDGQQVLTYKNPPVTSIPDSKGGYIMMNTWTGNANWGGGPPHANATSEYDWVKFWPDVTTVPAE